MCSFGPAMEDRSHQTTAEVAMYVKLLQGLTVYILVKVMPLLNLGDIFIKGTDPS